MAAITSHLQLKTDLWAYTVVPGGKNYMTNYLKVHDFSTHLQHWKWHQPFCLGSRTSLSSSSQFHHSRISWCWNSGSPHPMKCSHKWWSVPAFRTVGWHCTHCPGLRLRSPPENLGPLQINFRLNNWIYHQMQFYHLYTGIATHNWKSFQWRNLGQGLWRWWGIACLLSCLAVCGVFLWLSHRICVQTS